MILRRAVSWLFVMGVLGISASAPAQIRMQLPSSARECAMCHLDWMSAFQLAGEYTLIEKPTRGIVSAPPNCLGCHDASVDDSRRKVWLDHGHQTGIIPPEGMTVPDALPLDDGKIVCSTCHSAHGLPPRDREPTLADVFFLRIPNNEGQLCLACHGELAKGPQHGSHPLSEELAGGLPDVLSAAGAHLGDSNGQLICTSCHVPHGAQHDALLVMSPDSNAFCLSCHENMNPEMWGERQPHTHPTSTALASEAQRQVIDSLGTRVGSENQLICSSCHKMHHAPAGELLADTLEGSQLCLHCHKDQKTLFDTVHNLANSAPEAKNLRGRTAEQTGACGACHGVHRPAREIEASPLDPTGYCATCHQEGQCAEEVRLLRTDHPMPREAGESLQELIKSLTSRGEQRERHGMTCFTCHDPHANPHQNFLLKPPDQLCAHCHSDQMASLAGAHDFSEFAEAKNARGRTPQQAGSCGYCHAVHDAKGPVLWAADDVTIDSPNDLCLNCHLARDMPAHTSAAALRHPSGRIDLDRIPLDHWSLYDQKAHASRQGVLACSTCHDVHGDSTKSAALLRHEASADNAQWCLNCHTDVSTIAQSMHRNEELAALVERMNAPGDAQRCAPCHRVHQTETPVELGMWAAPLGSDEYPEDMRQCLGCHSSSGGATTMHVTVHPTVPMSNTVAGGEPGFLPLIDDQGDMGSSGRITCRTCHLPHGRQPGHSSPEVSESASSEELDRLGSLLRPYQSPNLCSDCHGLDGIGYYLYYHFPEKRLALQSP